MVKILSRTADLDKPADGKGRGSGGIDDIKKSVAEKSPPSDFQIGWHAPRCCHVQRDNGKGKSTGNAAANSMAQKAWGSRGIDDNKKGVGEKIAPKEQARAPEGSRSPQRRSDNRQGVCRHGRAGVDGHGH